MADVEDKPAQEALELAGSGAGDKLALGTNDSVVTAAEAAEALGADKYVFASFFAAGIGVAYLVGKTLETIWNQLADAAWVVRKAAFLLRFPEDERPSYTMLVGAVVGLLTTIWCLRRERLRRWAEDVALELSKVTWPKRETVTNGTIVVIAAGVFATVYIGLLDRLWGFVTMLVYGA
jgi:preprotein translocase subunit SecE